MLNEAKKQLEVAQNNVKFYEEVVKAAQGWDELDEENKEYIKAKTYPLIYGNDIRMYGSVLIGLYEDRNGMKHCTDSEILHLLGFLDYDEPTPEELLRAIAEFYVLYEVYKKDLVEARKKFEYENLFSK